MNALASITDLVSAMSPRSVRFSRHLRSTYRPAADSVAAGYTPGRQGVGGLRNHLVALQEYSRHRVVLFPERETLRLVRRDGLEERLREWRADIDLAGYGVVHSHVDPGFVRACARAQQRGSHWIHTYHTLYFPEDWGGTLAPWQEEINAALLTEARHADVRISISPWLQKVLREEHGIDSMVIPNGVRVSDCEAARPERFLEATGLAAGFVLFVGTIASVKNPLLFLELAASMPDRNFVMIGKSLLDDALAERWGRAVPDNVVALGPLAHGSTLDAMAAAGALVMPSRSEGLPTALMEAMAVGTPCVATNAFGCRDVIGDAGNGVLVPAGDLDGFREGVREALDGTELGASAAARIRERFDWKVVIRRIDTLYSEAGALPRRTA